MSWRDAPLVEAPSKSPRKWKDAPIIDGRSAVAPINPTADMSGMEKFAAGAGKAIVDTGRGLKQIGATVGNKVGLVSDETLGNVQSDIDESRRLDAALMNTGAGMAGNIAGTVATTLLPAAGVAKGAQALSKAAPAATKLATAANAFINPSTYKAAALAGGLQGAIQPVATGESRALNTAVGGAAGLAGQAFAKGIGRIAQPSTTKLDPSKAKAVAKLQSEGIPLDSAQLTGSKRLEQVKRALGDNPLTQAAQQAQFEKTATAFDRAALRTIGESADVADEEVMGRAAVRIGAVMDDIATRNPVKVSDKFLNKLTEISTQATSELETSQAQIIHNQVDEILNKAGDGAIDGKAYQNIRQTLGRLQGNPIPGVKHLAGELRAALDDALQESSSKVDSMALKEARKQWRNMEAIAKVIGSEEGQHISPSKLANALNTKAYGGKTAMVRGRGATDLMKLAKAGKTVLPEKFPNSGTAARAALQLALPAGVGAGYGYAKEGDLSGAAMYGLGGLAAPFALQRGLNSGYLANGLGGPMRNLLLAPQRNGITTALPAVAALELTKQP